MCVCLSVCVCVCLSPSPLPVPTALDSPIGVFDRLRMGFKRIFGDSAPLKSSAFVPTLMTKATQQQEQQEQQ